MNQDDLLEVRKSTCLARLTAESRNWDETVGAKLFKSEVRFGAGEVRRGWPKG